MSVYKEPCDIEGQFCDESKKGKEKFVNFSKDSKKLSLKIPANWRAFFPKFSMRQPGNLIVLFIVILLIVILSLGVAGTNHNYSGTNIIINFSDLHNASFDGFLRGVMPGLSGAEADMLIRRGQISVPVVKREEELLSSIRNQNLNSQNFRPTKPTNIHQGNEYYNHHYNQHYFDSNQRLNLNNDQILASKDNRDQSSLSGGNLLTNLNGIKSTRTSLMDIEGDTNHVYDKKDNILATKIVPSVVPARMSRDERTLLNLVGDSIKPPSTVIKNQSLSDIITEWSNRVEGMDPKQNGEFAFKLVRYWSAVQEVENGPPRLSKRNGVDNQGSVFITMSLKQNHNMQERQFESLIDEGRPTLLGNYSMVRIKRSFINGMDSSVSVCDNETIKEEISKIEGSHCNSYGLVVINGLKSICKAVYECPANYFLTNAGCINGVANNCFWGHKSYIPFKDMPRQEWFNDDSFRGVCSIEKNKLIECPNSYEVMEYLSVYVIMGNVFVTLKDYNIKISVDTKNESMYSCTGTNSGLCIGDEPYVKSHELAGTDLTCNCSLTGLKSQFELVFLEKDGETHGVDFYFRKLVKVRRSINLDSKTNCESCSVSCNQGIVHISSDDIMTFTEVCHNNFCEIMDKPSTFKVPLSLASHSNKFDLISYTSSGAVFKTKFECTVEAMCTLIDCTLCLSKLSNPECMTIQDKLLILVTISCWFILVMIIAKSLKIVLYFLEILKYFCKAVWWFIKQTVKLCLLCVGKRIKTSRVKLIKTLTDVEDGHELKEVEVRNKVAIVDYKPTTTKSKFRSLSYLYAFIYLASFIGHCTPCTETISLGSETLNCKQSDKSLSCSTSRTAFLALSPVGQEACMTLSSHDGVTRSTLKIKTNEINLHCDKKALFWTYSTRPKVKIDCRCFIEDVCTEALCTRYSKENKPQNPFVEDDGYLGLWDCVRADGGWGNGCFLTNDACCYYRMSLPNSGGVAYEVSKCPSYTLSIPVSIVSHSANETIKESLVLRVGYRTAFKYGTISIDSYSIPPMPVLSNCFVTESKARKLTWMYQCPSSGMRAGELGDIRCRSMSDAVVGSKSCKFDSGMIKTKRIGGSVKATTQSFDFGNLKTNLPIKSAGYKITKDEKGIMAKINHLSGIKLAINLKGFKVSGYLETRSCKTKFLTLGGCSNCLTGAKLSVEVKAKESTPISISCPSLKAPLLEVTNGKAKVEFQSHFSKTKIDEECKVVCPDSEETLKIKGSLMSDIKLESDGVSNYWEAASKASEFSFDFLPNFGFISFSVIGISIVLISILLFTICLKSAPRSYREKQF
nr:TPA_asm: glycoprotein [Beidivirus atrichopogon]